MTTESRDNQHFVQLVEALTPWLNQVVIIGGWAHRLYRLHPLSQHVNFAPLMTLDTDIVLPERLDVHEEDMCSRLHASGFDEEFFGEHRPPATHYTLGKDGDGFYAEFLTPLVGGNENRGKPTATARVAGITSQKLRYLELLLHAPWQITLQESAGFSVKEPMVLRIPNAASYLAQKLLIHNKREPAERAKHTVYIHDTIQTFGGSLPRLHQEWLDNVKPRLSVKTTSNVTRSSEELFSTVTDTIREASLVARSAGRNLSPDEVQRVCYTGLKQVFV